MKIGRGNRSTRRKPTPVPLCSPQIPLDQTRDRIRAAAVGRQRLAAWAMARPRTRYSVDFRRGSGTWHSLPAEYVIKDYLHITFQPARTVKWSTLGKDDWKIIFRNSQSHLVSLLQSGNCKRCSEKSLSSCACVVTEIVRTVLLLYFYQDWTFPFFYLLQTFWKKKI
jgi:hypothetical protein